MFLDQLDAQSRQEVRSTLNTPTCFWENMRERWCFQRGIAFPAWVSLGLVAASVGISLLELIANVFGRLRLAPIAGVEAILVYFVLLYIQPRLFPWPRHRPAYLIAIFTLTFALALLIPLQLRIGWYIAIYGIVAHARVKFKKRDGLLVEGMIVVAMLLGIALASSTLLGPLWPFYTHISQRYLIHPRTVSDNGVPLPDLASVPLQFGIWFLGLLFVHSFTGLGIQERSARLHTDELVQELTAAQDQLRAYALHVEELAIMRERARVAREVHDTLAQGLAAIKMHLETGAAVFEQWPEQARLHMKQASELASEHLNEARHSILELRADALDGRTLPSALAALAGEKPLDDVSCGDACATSFSVSGTSEKDIFWQTISPAVALTCYRVVQEALSNVGKHGQARRVEVELSVEEGELCLTITDDGIGFDPSSLSTGTESGGFGITGMHERLKLLNGRLEVISAPGAGTQVVAMVPLQVDEQ